MDSLVKKSFNPLLLIGVIFSFAYSFLYLNGDLALFDDVNNRNLSLYFYFSNNDFTWLITSQFGILKFIRDIPDLVTAAIQTFLITQGLLAKSIYIFFITELIFKSFRSKSYSQDICSRLFFYGITLFKPFSIIFWDHHQFFLSLVLFCHIKISNKFILRYITYLFLISLEFLLLPFLILTKTKTFNDLWILTIIFIGGVVYAFNDPFLNFESEPSSILSIISFLTLMSIFIILILNRNFYVLNPYTFLSLFFIFLFIGSAFFGQTITNRFLLDYIPIMPLLIINRNQILFNKNSFFSKQKDI